MPDVCTLCRLVQSATELIDGCFDDRCLIKRKSSSSAVSSLNVTLTESSWTKQDGTPRDIFHHFIQQTTHLLIDKMRLINRENICVWQNTKIASLNVLIY